MRKYVSVEDFWCLMYIDENNDKIINMILEDELSSINYNSCSENLRSFDILYFIEQMQYVEREWGATRVQNYLLKIKPYLLEALDLT